MQQMQFDLSCLVHTLHLKAAAPQRNFYLADNGTSSAQCLFTLLDIAVL